MRTVKILTAATIAAGLLSATPAFAVTSDVVASKPQAMAATMNSLGYKSTLGKDDVGDPMIETEMGGWKVRVLFYDCTDHLDCQSIQFYSVFDVDGDGMNPRRAMKWAADYRFGAISLDDEDDPSITWDVMIGSGISGDNFKRVCAKYENAVTSFGKYVFDKGS